MVRFAFALLASLMATPLLAQDAAAERAIPAEQTSAASAEDQKVKCRSVFVVGSRIPERICRTRAEWAQIERETREAMDQQRRTVGASGDRR